MHSFVESPNRPPHSCISCGAGTDRDWFLDLGENTTSPDEMMDTVFVCNLCFTAFAKEQGIVDQVPLLAEIKQLREDVFNYKTKAEALEHGLDDLVRARIFDPSVSAYSDLRDLLEAREQADGGSPEAGGQSEDLDRAASEPGAGPNLGAVPASFSFDGGAP